MKTQSFDDDLIPLGTALAIARYNRKQDKSFDESWKKSQEEIARRIMSTSQNIYLERMESQLNHLDALLTMANERLWFLNEIGGDESDKQRD